MPRSEDDPMKLYLRIMKELDNSFLMHNVTYIPGQQDLMAHAVEAILQATPGTATAIPFQPGLGKSTLIRSLLKVLACEFQQNTPIAQAIGGIIVVVEKTAEAEELELLCNETGNQVVVARAISSPNDYNLAQGKCLNGSASCYAECAGRSCPDYADCSLVQSASQIHNTPILIMLHARYQRYMEDMSSFLDWEDSSGQHSRTLLLIDELPPMIEDGILNVTTISGIESEIAQFKPSYQAQSRKEKDSLLYEWSRAVRNPFLKLRSRLGNHSGMFGIVSPKDMESAGFTQSGLQKLRDLLIEYFGTETHNSIQLVDVLLSARSVYYAVGQDVSLRFPRLRKICGEKQPATFLFSGTASLSPELSRNPDICSFPDQNLESFQRLQCNVQRGDQFNSSKSGLAKKRNWSALVAWLQSVLSQIAPKHKRIMVVTYKRYAADLWNDLRDFHDVLIPYIGSDGKPQPKLPYFGGMNGSNLYKESTCVICVGLNRFEPKDYISRALALDFDGTCRDEINTALEVQEGKLRLESMPCVMGMQDITLTRDIVQLVFRSALRNHGESQPIELWLLHPPNDVLRYLQEYFKDCQIQEITELPENCQLAVAANREYMGKQSHAGILLEFLSEQPEGASFTPAQIRDATNLTPAQFKEAKKHVAVRAYFEKHIETTGSGRNTCYIKKAA